MHLPGKSNHRSYPHVEIVYANNRKEAENLLLGYSSRGYLNKEEAPEVKSAAVREVERLAVLLDERYYYDEEGYLRAVCFMKNGSSYVRKIFHRLNHAKESIALVVKKNEKVYNTLLDLL